MSTTTELKPISEMTANEIADMMESGCVKMENVAPMYVRAIELLRRSAAHGESKVPQFIVRDAERAIDAATNPKGMHTNGPAMARIEASKLAALLRYAQMSQAGSAEQVSEREIKTWTDRVDWSSSEPAAKLMVEAMKAEIAELRAALTAPAPSTAGEWTDEQVDILRRAAEILEHDCGRPHNANELRALLSAPAQAQSEEAK